VFGFFDILEKIVDDNNLTATKIFNVDESGFSTVQKKNQKILARKGKSQVGVIASGERGVNTTMVVCTSAAGQYVAPMIIFKRKRMVTELGLGAPPGCIVQISDTGYSISELFLIWLKEFIKVVKPSKEDKVLLLLDGHTSHSKNLAAIELARTYYSPASAVRCFNIWPFGNILQPGRGKMDEGASWFGCNPVSSS
jgi:hypothetical protein